MIQNNGILATVMEVAHMSALLKRVLNRLGITVRVTTGPQTEDEWERERVLPIYQESLEESDNDDILDPKQIESFRRGDMKFSEVKPQN